MPSIITLQKTSIPLPLLLPVPDDDVADEVVLLPIPWLVDCAKAGSGAKVSTIASPRRGFDPAP